MIHRMAAIVGRSAVPDYDLDCNVEREGEVKQTQLLFPDGLAHQNAPRPAGYISTHSTAEDLQ